jgi:hypothetical protein
VGLIFKELKVEDSKASTPPQACEECNDKKVSLEYVIDPYQSGLSGKAVKRWLCDECLHDLSLTARAG